MPLSLPSDASLVFARKQAKDLKRNHHDRDGTVCDVLRMLPRFQRADDTEILDARVSLQEVQHALALEYGFSDWLAMRAHIEENRDRPEGRVGDVWHTALFTGSGDDVTLRAGVNRQKHLYSYTRPELRTFDDGFQLLHPIIGHGRRSRNGFDPGPCETDRRTRL